MFDRRCPALHPRTPRASVCICASKSGLCICHPRGPHQHTRNTYTSHPDMTPWRPLCTEMTNILAQTAPIQQGVLTFQNQKLYDPIIRVTHSNPPHTQVIFHSTPGFLQPAAISTNMTAVVGLLILLARPSQGSYYHSYDGSGASCAPSCESGCSSQGLTPGSSSFHLCCEACSWVEACDCPSIDNLITSRCLQASQVHCAQR